MSKRVVSIEDIANKAGVSHSTVSRALRNSPLISIQVREQIQALAREMGYIPNALAQSLHNSQTKTIGLIIRSISDPFFAGLVKGVEEVAKEKGFSLILSVSHGQLEQETDVIAEFHRRRVDGLLIADSQLTNSVPKFTIQRDIPIVLINRQAIGSLERLRSVGVNDKLGLKQAVEHLLFLGHRKIGYFGVENRPRSNQQRLLGYRESLAEAGIKPQAEWEVIIPRRYLEEQEEEVLVGEEFGARLIAAGLTAICCYNDMLAVGMLKACHKKELKVPDDISVVGYDNIALSRYVTPPLTTVQQPVIEMGREAALILIALMAGEQVEGQILSPNLVIRESTTSVKK